MKKYIQIIIYTVLFLFTFYITYVFTNKAFIDRQNLHYNYLLQEHQNRLNETTNYFERTASIFYSEVINKPEVVSLCDAAATGNRSSRDTIRQQLYNQIQVSYSRIARYGLDKMQFHLPNNISFLRLQQPDMFGDSLTHIRQTLNISHKIRQKTEGFEIGSTFAGYRLVYPLYYKQTRFVGSVELGISLNAHKIFGQKDSSQYLFMLKKSIIEDKHLKNNYADYQISRLNPDYLCPKQLAECLDTSILSLNTIERINKQIFSRIITKLQKSKSFVLSASLDDKYYSLVFIPIKNIENQQIAYSIKYINDQKLALMYSVFNKQLLIITILILFLFIVAHYFIHVYQKSKIENLKLFNIANKLGEGLLVLNKKEELIFINKKAVELLKITNKEQIIHQPISKLGILQKQSVFVSGEAVFICHDESKLDVEITVNSFQLSTKEKAKVISFKDITSQKNREQKENKTNRKLLELNDQLYADGIQKDRQKQILEKQMQLVKKQRDALEKHSKHTQDSIVYASRIQQAIFPHENFIKQVIPNYFILYKPKDIVSGDFYWMSKIKNKIIVAAGDCTGHGVPGAFMSMLGVASLNDIVNNQRISEPTLILNELKNRVISVLKQTGQSGDSNEGMDISICVINTKQRLLEFAGAYGSIIVIQPNPLYPKFERIKGDSIPIGFSSRREGQFTTHTRNIQHGDKVYLFSDGFADQIGGNKGRKLMNKRFNDAINQSFSKSAKKQKTILNNYFLSWKKDYPQVDDVLVIGLEINIDKKNTIKEQSKQNYFGKKVLIIDDNENDATLTHETLLQHNIISEYALTPRKGIMLFKQYDFDLVIVDIQMPLMSGYEVVGVLKTYKPTIPIITLSNYTEESHIQRAFKAGSNEYLTKPLNDDKLIQILHSLFKPNTEKE